MEGYQKLTLKDSSKDLNVKQAGKVETGSHGTGQLTAGIQALCHLADEIPSGQVKCGLLWHWRGGAKAKSISIPSVLYEGLMEV